MAERRSAREARAEEFVTDPPPLSAAQAGQRGLRQVAELTGRDPEGISGVEPSQDGWLVTVEVVEDARIPSSTDVIATYQAELDLDGELISYRRMRRFARGRGDEGII
ncbi:gas vesicle protein [Trebonia kvetii]|uniref:Gas vesicle protein n=1 Tax=Trebonia kvetii TaxID=2480626 RepID=A0A6P2BU52_9ACTN|nr:gas vesicle protein [Trebonia kvetii]TVZ00743.1 gas vesicle protein [Trebonia kvetii]